MSPFFDAISKSLERAALKLRPHVMFTALNTVGHILDRHTYSLLDVGCGKGELMRSLKSGRSLWAVGVDIFEPYLRECLRNRSHNALVRADVRYLPFQPRSFDVVLCMEVLEHLTRDEGLALLRALELLCRKQVIVSTPVGRHHQHEYDGNPYQEHRHIWEPRELRQLGYQVIGHGFRGLGGQTGPQTSLPKVAHPFVYLVWVLAGPLSRILPDVGGNMVCIKRIAP